MRMELGGVVAKSVMLPFENSRRKKALFNESPLLDPGPPPPPLLSAFPAILARQAIETAKLSTPLIQATPITQFICTWWIEQLQI